MPERTRMKNHKFWCVCLVSLLVSLDGCERDAVKTQSNNFTKIKMAAEAGEPVAQCNLGLLYLNGFEVPQDDKKAAIWFRAAAEQGNAYAQRCLSLAYLTGRGVPKDEIESYAWLTLSAAGGDDTSVNALRYAEDRRSADQLLEAKAKAGEYLRQYGSGNVKPR